jgi:hypothetical protein
MWGFSMGLAASDLLVGGGQLGDAGDADLLLALAGLGDVVGRLHTHEGVHFDAEGFLDAEGHVTGEVGLGVEQAGKGGPGDAEGCGCGGDGEAGGREDLGTDEIAGVGWVLHGLSLDYLSGWEERRG